MAPIRYRYTDSDLPRPPLYEDNSEGWWAGVRHCFVAVPLAGTLAAVVLSTSLAFGYQQQTEDIVPQPPQIAAEEYLHVRTPSAPALRFLYLPDPEELPAGALFGQPDDELWQVFTPHTPPILAQLWAVDDDIVPQPTALAAADDPWESFYVPPSK